MWHETTESSPPLNFVFKAEKLSRLTRDEVTAFLCSKAELNIGCLVNHYVSG